ncbi:MULTISPECIES: YraN family protein [Helicobacter]|uniref:YraN family protein n=1 Tax=Helicobacter TaxID=209 RepID=UPI000EB31381|nr:MULTISPECIES: YraN family protein [Helicobacter]
MSRDRGLAAEALACAYLVDRGCVVVARNFSCPFGEIDIIALRGGVLHFVEVKQRQHTSPIYALTRAKLARLAKTIQVYLQKHAHDMPYCIDALLIKGSLQHHTIEWLENIGWLE